jgi:hypothetical protein
VQESVPELEQALERELGQASVQESEPEWATEWERELVPVWAGEEPGQTLPKSQASHGRPH